MRAMMMVLMMSSGCSRLTIEPTPDAAIDVDPGGVPCRAATRDGGIEYDCVFDSGELGVCADGPAYPVCHHRCSSEVACDGVRVELVNQDGAAVCYCR